MKGDQEVALNASCDGYLTKPIDTRIFVDTIASIIKDSESGGKNKLAA